MEAYIPAIISGLISLIVCIINSRTQFSKVMAENDKNIALIQKDIRMLSDRVDKHNNLVERMYSVETKLAVMEQEITDEK